MNSQDPTGDGAGEGNSSQTPVQGSAPTTSSSSGNGVKLFVLGVLALVALLIVIGLMK